MEIACSFLLITHTNTPPQHHHHQHHYHTIATTRAQVVFPRYQYSPHHALRVCTQGTHSPTPARGLNAVGGGFYGASLNDASYLPFTCVYKGINSRGRRRGRVFSSFSVCVCVTMTIFTTTTTTTTTTTGTVAAATVTVAVPLLNQARQVPLVSVIQCLLSSEHASWNSSQGVYFQVILFTLFLCVSLSAPRNHRLFRINQDTSVVRVFFSSLYLSLSSILSILLSISLVYSYDF